MPAARTRPRMCDRSQSLHQSLAPAECDCHASQFLRWHGLLAAIHATAALGMTDAMIEWHPFDLKKHICGEKLASHSAPPNPGLGCDPPNPDPNLLENLVRASFYARMIVCASPSISTMLSATTQLRFCQVFQNHTTRWAASEKRRGHEIASWGRQRRRGRYRNFAAG